MTIDLKWTGLLNLLWYYVGYQSLQCNTTQYHAIQCNTMQYHAIPCNTRQTRQDQERGMNGPASLLPSWHWVLVMLLCLFHNICEMKPLFIQLNPFGDYDKKDIFENEKKPTKHPRSPKEEIHHSNILFIGVILRGAQKTFQELRKLPSYWILGTTSWKNVAVPLDFVQNFGQLLQLFFNAKNVDLRDIQNDLTSKFFISKGRILSLWVIYTT